MLPKVEIRKKEKFENIKISNFMPEIIEKFSVMKPKKVDNPHFFQTYETAVGEEISAVSSVLKFENNTLTIKVKGAVWKNELKFREEEIRKMLNSQKNRNFEVKKIIFK